MLSYLSQFYELFRKESVERDAAGMIQYCYNISVSFSLPLPLLIFLFSAD